MSDDIKLEDHERQRCEVWSRVMGYFRPVEGWNMGKQAEFAERKNFDEGIANANQKYPDSRDSGDSA